VSLTDEDVERFVEAEAHTYTKQKHSKKDAQRRSKHIDEVVFAK